ncbi:hypothetical protein HCEG_01502 [Histoplasma capsulatum var. duboisii H88]|uniref:Uncharacterized protein n=1 Tax=Ajellomyces capsulatus (strain H88) TaxID=544711 RepID=F0U5K3_AJEC8|nr:hypothetical protein HCEG_01502 [Histoplasma capsulatum var. duboisii H88]
MFRPLDKRSTPISNPYSSSTLLAQGAKLQLNPCWMRLLGEIQRGSIRQHGPQVANASDSLNYPTLHERLFMSDRDLHVPVSDSMYCGVRNGEPHTGRSGKCGRASKVNGSMMFPPKQRGMKHWAPEYLKLEYSFHKQHQFHYELHRSQLGRRITIASRFAASVTSSPSCKLLEGVSMRRVIFCSRNRSSLVSMFRLMFGREKFAVGMPPARPEQQSALFQKMNAACCGAIPLQICPAFASALCPPTTSNTSYTSRCAWRGPLNFVRRVGGRLSVMVMDGEPASRLYWTYWSTFWIHEEREIWIKLAVLNPAYQYFVPLIQSCSPIIQVVPEACNEGPNSLPFFKS